MPDIEFRDSFKLALPEKEQLEEYKDSIGGFMARKKLSVSMEASHAGITNLNSRFYLPSSMEDGVSDLSKGKPRPILKHHKADEDPVGKVVSAEYVSTLSDDVFSVAPEAKDLVDSSLSLKKRIRAARKFIRRGITANDQWQGMGYMKLNAEVSDSKTIEQLENGLFDSVSIGFTSDHAFCSICGADWLDDDDGICDHFPPGKVFENEDGEKEKQYLIPGKMKVKECSFVNFDADPHTNITIEGPSLDGVNKDYIKQESLFDSEATWSVQDSKEDSGMKFTINDKVVELSDQEANAFKLVKKEHEADADAYVAEAVKEIVSSLEDASDENVIEAYKERRTEDQKVGSYEAFEEELQKMVDEELLSEEEMKDAKLSSSTRKELPGSVFCGPDRSFPVNDCAHCTAAKRLIGRYKGPGDKSKIKACIERKCKSLGCDEGKKNGDSEPEPSPTHELEKKSNDELLEGYYETEAELIKRSLKPERPCSQCADNQKKAEDASKEALEVKEKLEDAESTVAVLRGEYRLCNADLRTVVNDSIDAKHELDLMKKKYVSLLAVLSKKQDSLEKAEEFFNDTEDFDKEYKKLTDSFDLNDFVVKFSSGMDHDPEGTVNDPVYNDDKDNKQKSDGLSKPAQAVIAAIKDFLKDNKKDRAIALFSKMRGLGVLTDETKFEDLVDSDSAGE